MTQIEVLQSVRTLLSDRNRWTTGTAARNISGESVDANSSAACCWCLLGAIYKCCGEITSAEIMGLLHKYTNQFNKSVVAVNDYQGYDAVLALIDLTLKEAAKAAAGAEH